MPWHFFFLYFFPFICLSETATVFCVPLLVPEQETFTCTYSFGMLWPAFTATVETGNVTSLVMSNCHLL